MIELRQRLRFAWWQRANVAAMLAAVLRDAAGARHRAHRRARDWSLAAAPPPPALVAAYLRCLGVPPDRYAGTLPGHLFPQWTAPAIARALTDAPFPIARVLTSGCRLDLAAPLSLDAPLQVRARVDRIERDDRRALVHQRVACGPATAPEALVATLRGFVPLTRGPVTGSTILVPPDARAISHHVLDRRLGLDLAVLTGDCNPIHWCAPYARAAGLPGVVLHGMGVVALAQEAVIGALLGGDPTRLAGIDVLLPRAVVLPGTVRVFAAPPHEVFVGDAPGLPAILAGRWKPRVDVGGG